MTNSHPTDEDLAVISDALRSWRIERFTDRANRQVLKLFPPEADRFSQPFEIRVPK